MKNSLLTKLQTLSLNDSLPHAWLLVGADQETKLALATKFSQWSLCADKQADSACGICKYCKLFLAGNHPDFCVITQQENNSIVVDEVRTLNTFLSSSAQFGQKKIVLIYPAERMNTQAANALLKNLEEPGRGVLFFLLATHTDLLLTTIVSRCQILRFTEENDVYKDNMQRIEFFITDLNNLLVTKAVTPVELVEKWLKQGQNEVLYWFELTLAYLIRCRYTQEYVFAASAAINNRVPANKLWAMFEQVQQARRSFASNYNPNLQLILENIVLV